MSRSNSKHKYIDGWCIRDEYGLSIHTVAESRLLAIINWLCERAKIFDVRTKHRDDIEYLWLVHGEGKHKAQVVQVRVTALVGDL
jgi:hypothetical protein